MLTLTTILMRSILTVATVGGLAALADRAVRSQLERAVQGDLSFMGHAPAPVRLSQTAERFVAKGLDRTRLKATVLMVGADDAQ